MHGRLWAKSEFLEFSEFCYHERNTQSPFKGYHLITLENLEKNLRTLLYMFNSRFLLLKLQ